MFLFIINCRKNTCGSTVYENCSYITNPSYPSTFDTAGSCAFNIKPCQSGKKNRANYFTNKFLLVFRQLEGDA